MKRTERVTAHVSEQTKDELEVLAAQKDTSVSSLVNDMLLRQLRHEEEGTISSQSRAVERIERQIDRGERRLADVADDVRDLNARGSVYAVALFELLKSDHPPVAVNEALDTGARRLRADDPIEAGQVDAADAEPDEPESNGGEAFDPRDPYGGDR